MDTILFSGVGCGLIFLAFFLMKKHKHFMSHSTEVEGEIIDFVEKWHTTRTAMGGVEDQRLLKHPVVKYRYNKSYKFQSDMDVTKEAVKIGSRVTVRIDPMQPKAAKLDMSLKSNSLMFILMIGLGVFLIGIGSVQFKPSDFTNLSLFDDWVTLGFVVMGGFYLYVKLGPLFSFLKYNSIYTENAEEVD